jgi:hypothetical protein
VLADETLPKHKRDDIASAIRTVARALQRAPEDLPAQPADLTRRLKGFAPAAAGLTESRWRNAVSLLRFALRHFGIMTIPGRSTVPFALAWTALFGTMKRMGDRMALSRFARYCTDRGVDPDDVSDQIFADFLEDLTHRALIDQPRRVQRRAALAWNRMVSSTRNWPTQLITIPSYSRVYVIPWDRFPASLKADIDGYLDHLAGKDILSELTCKPLRPPSIRTIRHQLHSLIWGWCSAARTQSAFARLGTL